MEHKTQLVKLIVNNENRNIAAFLKELKENSPCPEYADAREKILLVETAKSLNAMIPAFYVDVENLIAELFKGILATENVVDILCEKVRESAKEDRREAFQKACSFIEANLLSNQLTVAMVSDYTGLTQSSLVKLFSEKTGMTPGAYIGKLRVEKSLPYLAEDFSVEKTSEKAGFSSVEAYIRAFKKNTGMTPGVWKRKNLSL